MTIHPYNTKPVKHAVEPVNGKKTASSLLHKFLQANKDLDGYKNGKPVTVDGHTLTIPAVTAAARYAAKVQLDDSTYVRDRVQASRNVIASKVENGISVYGVSTGFGGSADTRTDDAIALGSALLQHQHSGVTPTATASIPTVLPLGDPLSITTMPEAWVRGAMLIRMNSLIRGHSGVRWELIESMGALLRENITPVVPLRGSISASGDLSSLSYIAGTLVGNPSIKVYDGPQGSGPRRIVSSVQALHDHGLSPLPLASKEHLGILNGTAFSASVASLALHDAAQIAIMAEVCTAMGVEALLGTQASFDPFIHKIARPHPGQIEAASTIHDLLASSTLATTHEEEMTIEQDQGKLRQDRYALRTAPQFLGPQIEDILSALETVTIECNSTTDNPLIDGTTGLIHHGGNFQAMSLTNALESTRLSLHHIGKLLFAQLTELLNPTMNRGLPPNLSATDPSLNYACKGIDIAAAAYVGELGWLAGNVSTHVQSAEMHNQSVNSLALISARATIQSLDVLSMLVASYLYALCQALDLRALQTEFYDELAIVVQEELASHFGSALALSSNPEGLEKNVFDTMRDKFDATATMDGLERMRTVVGSVTGILVDTFSSLATSTSDSSITASFVALPTFQSTTSSRLTHILHTLRVAYLTGARGPAPAGPTLRRTRGVYEFVRGTCGVRMHGVDNLEGFENGYWNAGASGGSTLGFNASAGGANGGHSGGHGVTGLDTYGLNDAGLREGAGVNGTIGESVSVIYEAIRDGKMAGIVGALFA